MNDAHNKAPMGVQRAGDNVGTKGFPRSGEGAGCAWSSCCRHCWSQSWAKGPPGARASKGRPQGWALPRHTQQQPAQGGRGGSAQPLQPRSSRALHHPPVQQGVRSTQPHQGRCHNPSCALGQQLAAAASNGHGGSFGTQGWDSEHGSGTAPGAAVLWSCLRLLSLSVQGSVSEKCSGVWLSGDRSLCTEDELVPPGYLQVPSKGSSHLRWGPGGRARAALRASSSSSHGNSRLAGSEPALVATRHHGFSHTHPLPAPLPGSCHLLSSPATGTYWSPHRGAAPHCREWLHKPLQQSIFPRALQRPEFTLFFSISCRIQRKKKNN
ncbi:hypothetical protein Nmel_014410 [Mimus melanotis]